MQGLLVASCSTSVMTRTLEIVFPVLGGPDGGIWPHPYWISAGGEAGGNESEDRPARAA
jgi:hypothetical protein